MSWKNPMLTGGLLVFINLGALIFNKMGLSLIGVAVWKIMIASVLMGIKERVAPSDKE